MCPYGNANDVNQLTNYNGNDITYDSDGNMTNFNGFIYTWDSGNLVGATGNGKAAAYVYNASGIRTMKVLNGKVTNYTLDGNNIDSETTGGATVNYVYDSNGSPVYFTLNGTAYYYERNLQGDITGIVDSTGAEVVKYSYDSWGKLLSITGTLATTVGEANRLRYRGYYYDTESGLYYLQSRYYNPEIGRFISKDDPIFTEGQTGVRANAYAYCLNNPVMDSDPNGFLSLRAAGLIIDAILLAINIGIAAIGMKATIKLIGIFAKEAVKLTKKKIIALVTPVLGTVVQAIVGFAIPGLFSIADYMVDLFMNASLGYAIALAVYTFIPVSRKFLTK